MKNDLLSEDNRRDQGITREWDQGNQQWWNWYMASADPALAGEVPSSGPSVLLPRMGREPANFEAIRHELQSPYALDASAVGRFQRDGYVKLKQVLSPGSLASLRQEMTAILTADLGEHPDLEFRSGEMMWLKNEVCKEFVLSPRIRAARDGAARLCGGHGHLAAG